MKLEGHKLISKFNGEIGYLRLEWRDLFIQWWSNEEFSLTVNKTKQLLTINEIRSFHQLFFSSSHGASIAQQSMNKE